MPNEQLALYWMIFGVTLIFFETLLPGLISIFLGLAALIVAGAIWVGWLNSWALILTSWFILSLILLFTLRILFARIAPGDTHRGSAVDDENPLGTIVTVQRTIAPDREDGRVSHRDTTWPAKSDHHVIHPGQKARLMRKEGSLWIVAPVDPPV